MMKEFSNFIRKQGVVGLAIGFLMGGAVSKLVGSFVNDIIQPFLGMIFGSTEGLKSMQYESVTYGNFIATFIDFLIVALVVYFVLGKLAKLDKEKEPTTKIPTKKIAKKLNARKKLIVEI